MWKIIPYSLLQSILLAAGQLMMKFALNNLSPYNGFWRFIGKELTNWWWLGCGISMGGASVLLASSLELPENVKFLVNDCGYSDGYEELKAAARFMNIPPVLYAPQGWLLYKILEGVDLKKDRPVDEVKKARLPILTIHGEADTFVPFSMCKEIYEACATEKELVTVPEATHGMSYLVDTEKCNEVIQRWIDKYLYK